MIVLPERGDRTQRDDRDQRMQQSVLEQILAFVVARKRGESEQTAICIIVLLEKIPQSEERRVPRVDAAPGTGSATSYAAPPSAPAIAVKIPLTEPPAAVTAAIATSAISATSNAYSSRSWPSSLRVDVR